MKPLAIDLYCGLGGWAEGLLSAGYRVIGFDIERHDYGSGGYPGQLVLQDVLTLDGSQFRDASIIVASPPCQAYSYRAMPWKRARALPPPDNALFDACFRIQREACEAAGRYIPMVVENVCGAQKWVGRAKWHYGSFYLWGDVPALMPDSPAIKISGFRFDGSGHSFQSASVEVIRGLSRIDARDEQIGSADSVAGGIHDRTRAGEACGVLSGMEDTFGWPRTSALRNNSSHSPARKAASAMIAKIPHALARHIAEVYAP